MANKEKNKIRKINTIKFNLLFYSISGKKHNSLGISKFDIFNELLINDDFSFYLIDLFLENLTFDQMSFSDLVDFNIYNDDLFISSHEHNILNSEKLEKNNKYIYLSKYVNEEPTQLKPLNECLKRKCLRFFSKKKMNIKEFSEILFYSFKRFDLNYGYNHYASGGGLYPIDSYVYINNVSGIAKGLYLYDGIKNRLLFIQDISDFNANFCENLDNFKNLYNYSFVIIFVWNSNFSRFKYGNNSLMFALIESGLMSQNLDLVVQNFGSGLCFLGGYNRNFLEKHICNNSFFSRIIHVGIVGKR